MKIIDRLLENVGYYKSPKIAEIISAIQESGLFGGLFDDDNLWKFLKAYNSEAYIYACVYKIAISIAGVEFKVYKNKVVKGEVIPQEIPDHPLKKLIDNPNPFVSDFDFKEATSAYLELTGDSFWLLDDLFMGKPKEMYVLMSDRMKIFPHPQEYIEKYEYDPNKLKDPIIFKPLQISHMKFFKPTSMYYGLSAVSPIMKEADTYRRAQIDNNNVFKEGMRKDFVLSTKERLNKDVYERMKEQLRQEYEGEHKAHGPMILEQGMEAKSASLSPKDLEFEKGIKLLRETVCSVFGVPPALIGLLEFANYANVKEQRQIFWQDTIVPKLTKWNASYTKLARRWDDIAALNGAYVVADLSKIKALKDDEKIKSEIAKTYFGFGVPYNMIAKELDLPVKDIPGGDIGYIPFNLIAVGSTQEAPKPAPKPEPKPAEEEGKVVKMEEKKIVHKWNMFKTLTENLENKYKTILNKFFDEQEKEVIANLNKHKNINYEQVMEGVFRFYEEFNGETYIDKETKETKHKIIKQKIDIETILFDEKGQVEKYSKMTKPVYTNMIKESADQEIAEFNLGISFDVTNPRVAEWVKVNGLRNAKLVNDTAKESLRKTLVEGIGEGESIDKLKKRIEENYKKYGYDGGSTERIARTETISASNQGALESYQQAKVEKKAWISARSGDARENHVALEELTIKGIPIDDDFHIPGNGAASAPGQSGDPAEDCNCRCTVIPIIKE